MPRQVHIHIHQNRDEQQRAANGQFGSGAGGAKPARINHTQEAWNGWGAQLVRGRGRAGAEAAAKTYEAEAAKKPGSPDAETNTFRAKAIRKALASK